MSEQKKSAVVIQVEEAFAKLLGGHMLEKEYVSTIEEARPRWCSMKVRFEADTNSTARHVTAGLAQWQLRLDLRWGYGGPERIYPIILIDQHTNLSLRMPSRIVEPIIKPFGLRAVDTKSASPKAQAPVVESLDQFLAKLIELVAEASVELYTKTTEANAERLKKLQEELQSDEERLHRRRLAALDGAQAFVKGGAFVGTLKPE